MLPFACIMSVLRLQHNPTAPPQGTFISIVHFTEALQSVSQNKEENSNKGQKINEQTKAVKTRKIKCKIHSRRWLKEASENYNFIKITIKKKNKYTHETQWTKH